jgi:hypothetical protein
MGKFGGGLTMGLFGLRGFGLGILVSLYHYDKYLRFWEIEKRTAYHKRFFGLILADDSV